MKKMKRTILAAALLCLAACRAAPPHREPASPPPIAATTTPPAPVDPEQQTLPLYRDVRAGRLPNGLRYFVLPHHKPENRALLWLAVDAGSVLEDDDQRGLAHFAEHMAFNGTAHFPKQSLVQYLESIGMRFGPDLNAYTSFDQTVYQLEIPTDRPDTLDRGLAILRDWAGDVSFDPKEVEAERGVVREEWRLGRGAQQRIFDKQAVTLFAGTRYAERLTIGDVRVIETAPPATLRRFYTDWYRPDLMAVIVVGEVDPATIEKQITERFSDLKNPKQERPRIPGGVPRADGTRISVVTDREAVATTVSIIHPLAARARASRRDYRRLLTEELYQMLLNERFAVISRRPDAPFLSAGSGINPMTRSFDAMALVAQAKRGRVDDALRGAMTEVLRVEKHGFVAAELERAKVEMLRTFEQSATTAPTQDGRVFAAELVRYAFENELMIGRPAELELARAILPTITIADLTQLVSQLASEKNRVVLIAGPDNEPLPKEADIVATLADLGKQAAQSTSAGGIAPWVDQPAAGALMTTLPKPGKIVAEKKVAAIDVTEWTLSNGARVIVKPTDYERDQVLMLGSSPGGDAILSDADSRTAKLAPTLIGLGGVGDYDIGALQKILNGKRAKVALSVEDTTETLMANGSVTDLETLLQLVHLKMTAPRLDPIVIGVAKAQFVQVLTTAEHNPEYQFAKRSTDALWHDDMRHKQTEAADLEKLDAQRALAIYRDRFGNAGDWLFVIVGAVDLPTLRPLVEQYLGGLPATKRKEIEKDRKVRKVPGVVKKSWQIGQAPKARVQLDFHGDQAWTRDNDRDMHNLVQVLNLRLREVLREDKGGVYGVQVTGKIQRSPHAERSIGISFGCDPLRTEELIAATLAEIETIKQQGIAEDYLAKVRATWLRGREKELRTNRFWVGWLLTSYFYGDDATIALDANKMAERATSANVKAAAQKYLDKKQYFQAVLLPEK